MTTKEEYVHLYFDSNDKITPSIFLKKVFIRVANLNKPQPLVQINDLIFKGTYEECPGTNLFFEEVANPPPKTNIYEKETPIRLKHVVKQSKMLKLQQMRLPKKVTSKLASEPIALNLNQDYETILKKLEQGILNIEELGEESEGKEEEMLENPYLEKEGSTCFTEPVGEIAAYLGLLGDQSATNLLETKYENLKRLARQPVLRTKSEEAIEEPDPKYKSAYEYHNLEKTLLQDTFFRSPVSPIISQNFVGGVDFDGCSMQGVLPHPNFKDLNGEELNKVFSIDNLRNLSLPARHLVLTECVKQIQQLMENYNSDELRERDENGRNITDILEIFQKLVAALERHLQVQELDCQVTCKGGDPEYVEIKNSPGVLSEDAHQECYWSAGKESTEDAVDEENPED